jgi:ABC-type bacteriocin/lantibiotic exporter with double-glycine peptidase domain
MYGALLVLLIASQGMTGPNGTDDDYQTVDDQRVQKMRVICGPNSLYLLLRTWNVPVTYTEVDRQLPTVERGTTLLALRQTAAHFGLPTRVRKCTAESLKALNLPSIVHLRANFRVDGRGTHYVLLYAISESGLVCIDGTTGLREDITWAKFHQYWTGYVVEPVSNPPLLESPLLQVPIFLANLACVLLAVGSPTLVGRLGRLSIVMALVGWLGCAHAAPARADEDAPGAVGDEIWRTPSYDAVNSLDLYLRLVNHPAARDRIRAALGNADQQATLLDLKRAIQALGQPSRVAKSSPGRLATYPLPVIVHLYDEQWQHGSYFVLFHINKDEYRVLNGASATVEVLPVDEFRRRWSGYALVAEDGGASWWQAAAIALCVCAGAMWARSRKPWVRSRSLLAVSGPASSPMVNLS